MLLTQHHQRIKIGILGVESISANKAAAGQGWREGRNQGILVGAIHELPLQGLARAGIGVKKGGRKLV